jgi:hypothetical protein
MHLAQDGAHNPGSARVEFTSPGVESETAEDSTALEATPEAVDVAARFLKRDTSARYAVVT